MANRIKGPSEKFVRGTYDGKGILEQLSERDNERTPDFLERKLEGYIPVFVYGSLRQGFMNHHIVKGMPFLGSGFTTIEKYEMREAGQGAFPVVFERELKIKGKKRNPVVGKIIGEIYVVDPKTLLTLDRLEDNGNMYKREMQWIFLDQQKIRNNASVHPSIKCWMYLGNEKFWQGRAPVDTCRSKMRNGVRYYDWSDVFESNWTDDGYDPQYGYLAQ